MAIFVVVATLTLTRAPEYAASATLLLNERPSDVLHLNSLTPTEAQAAQAQVDSSTVDTQVEVIESRTLASRVVDELHLERDPEFNAGLRPPSRWSAVLRLFNGGATGLINPEVAHRREHEGVVDATLGGLKVERIGLTYALNVTYKALKPDKAAALANAFVEQYLTQQFNSRLEQTSSANSWLDSRLADLKRQAENADAAVQQYKIAHNLLSAQGATLTEQEISNLDTQLDQARAAEAEQDARLKTAVQQLAQGSNGGDVGEALNNPVVQNLQSQRAQASGQLATLQAKLGPKHPQVIKAKQTLVDIDEQIQAEIERVISSLKAQSTVAHTRTAAIAGSVLSSRGALAASNRENVGLEALQRDDDAARTIYEAFLARYKESIARQGDEQAEAHVISTAEAPFRPSAPNKKLDVLLALGLGLVGGSIAVLLAELLSHSLSTSYEVEAFTNLPALGEVPLLASTLNGRPRRRVDPMGFVVEKPFSRFTESFRNLRAAIAASRSDRRPQVVALTSALPGEGKTTTAVCLARTAAISGVSVVLVDCDLRQRSVNRALAAEPKAGLVEVLSGEASLEEALMQDADTGAYFLPLSASSVTPRDVFGTTAMTQLLDALRARFELVLLDTAPVLAVADTRVLCPKADAVVVLARWRKTSRKALHAALSGFSGDTYLAGVALTQVNVREQARAGDGSFALLPRLQQVLHNLDILHRQPGLAVAANYL